MSTPPAWLTPHAQTAAHPAAYRQHGAAQTRSTVARRAGGSGGNAPAAYTGSVLQRLGGGDGGGGHTPVYTASRSTGAALYEPYGAPSDRATLTSAAAGMADGEPHFTSVYSTAPGARSGTYTHHLNDTDDRFAVRVDDLAFGAPGLAEAMVHQEASARESAEQKLDEERARCELLQHEIQRLQAQLTGGGVDWKCPICYAIFPRAEKDEHGKRCLTQFVEFVQSGGGSPGVAAAR